MTWPLKVAVACDILLGVLDFFEEKSDSNGKGMKEGDVSGEARGPMLLKTNVDACGGETT